MDVAVALERQIAALVCIAGSQGQSRACHEYSQWMESFNGRFKTEGHSLFLEAQSSDDLVAVVDDRMCYYNTERRHSSIGYVPPLTYIERMRSDLNTRL